jgi:uncharacterized BrkB/YihY/UPF0761 family membrane protein
MASDDEGSSPVEPDLQGSAGSGRVERLRATAGDLEGRARARLEQERRHRGWVAVLVATFERDRTHGAALLAGGLAYRIFLWQLPAVLFVVSAFGIAADVSERSPTELARSAGISASLASAVADGVQDAGRGRWFLAVFGLLFALWAARSVVRSLILIERIAWGRVGRRLPVVRAATVFTFGMFAFVGLQSAISAFLGDRLVSRVLIWVVASAVVLVMVTLAMLWLPHGGSSWVAIVPGAVVFTLGFRLLSVAVEVYFAPHLSEETSVYGSIGIAIVVMLVLFVNARVFILSQFLNAEIAGADVDDPLELLRSPGSSTVG